MKKLILITAILFSINLQGQSFNEVESDKLLHFSGGAVFAVPGYFLGLQMSNGDRATAFKVSVGVGTLVTILKETTDIPSTGFSVEDVGFGALGALASAYVTDWIFQSHGSKQRREALRIEKEKKRLDKIYE